MERVRPVRRAQLLSYLRLTGLTLGLILNFNVPHMRQGIYRVINGPEFELWSKTTFVSVVPFVSIQPRKALPFREVDTHPAHVSELAITGLEARVTG